MRSPPLPRPVAHRLLGCLTVTGLLLAASAALAQADRASEDSVKAGFVFNFAKFTEWPSRQANAPLRICALGRNPLNGQLAELAGRSAQGRNVETRVKILPAEASACQILFLSADDLARNESLLAGLADQAVLTVSDAPGFCRQGGMIELRQIDNRLRFEINPAAAQHAGLRLSSQLLKLATRLWP